MGFRDDIDDEIEEMWEMDQIYGETRSSGKTGCSYGFWKFILIIVIIYWLIDLIFGK